MKKSVFIIIFACTLLLNLTSCMNEEESSNKKSVELDNIATQYYEAYLKLYPLDATAQGDLRYNDQLPINISKNFINKEVAFYKDVQAQLKKVNYNNLSDDDKVIFDALTYTVNDKIEFHTFHPEYIPFTQFDGLPLQFPVMGSGQGIQPFNTLKDYEDWIKRMEAFPAWMAQAKENFKEGIVNKMVLPKKLVIKMIPQMKAEELISKNSSKNIFFGSLKNFPQNFSDIQKQEIERKYREVIFNKIIPAYTDMGNFLEQDYLPNARVTDGYNALPHGDSIYKHYVKSWTTTNETPENIFQIGKIQVEILRAEMLKVKNELGFEGSLYDFTYHIAKDPKATPYQNTKEVLDAFQSILSKINPKLKTMFKVTPKTPFEIRQTEKFREATASAEYIQGTPDGKRPGIFYIPLPNPKQYNITNGMESLFLHEAIPGHHYQVSLQQENMGLPKFMRFGWVGAYGEGWAHYCETLGTELGLYKDPYQKMGYLNDQMLRAVRLVIDVSLHTGMLSREIAIAYYLNNIADSEANAISAIERYMALPGQALSYKMGSLKIIELKEKYQKQLGAKFNVANFHQEILSQGCLPLGVLERKMEVWAKK